jgi:hypothetical protein
VTTWATIVPMTRKRRRPTLRMPESLGGVLGRAGDDRLARHTESISQRDWEAAVGARIAERARPIELDRGTLIVRVATSVWASELSLLATPILARLKAEGHAVHALRYRVGDIEPSTKPKALRVTRVAPPAASLPRAVEGALASVTDDELRAAITGAARANLAWQSYVTEASAAGSQATSGGPRGARVPQSAERESDRPDRTTASAGGAPRRRP